MVSVKLQGYDEFAIEGTREGYVLLDSGKAVCGPFTLKSKSALTRIMEYTEAPREIVENAFAELSVLASQEAKWKKARQQEPKPSTPSDAEKDKILDEEASALLSDPKLLFRIKEDMDRTIKGENENKLLMFLLECSARTKDYTFADALGESAVGKTNLVGGTLRYVPCEWWRKVGRMTRTAVDYLTDQDFCLLWIQEARGAGEAAPSIRLQSADDGGLAIWTTERDEETGRFTTNEYSVPGRGVITTTTNVSFSPEDSTRTWMISVDASEEQTRRIVGYKLGKAKEPPELLEALGRKSVDLAPVVQTALKMLEWDSPVIIPYADDLASLFSPRLVRARRDVDKFLGLVKVIARLHQRQRPMPEINGKRFIVSTAQDAIIAFQLGGKSLEETLTGLEKRLRKVYDAVVELGTATSTQVGIKIHKGSEYARRALSVLTEMAYVDVDESQKTHTYSVRQTENPSSDLHSIQRTFSGLELQKKVNSFLFSISSQPLDGTPRDGVNGYCDPIDGNYVDFKILSLQPEVERGSQPSLNQASYAEKNAQMSSSDLRGDPRAFPISKLEPETVEIENKASLDTSPVKLTRLTTNIIDKCMNPECRFQGRVDWQATYPDGSWGLLCSKCGLELARKLGEVE